MRLTLTRWWPPCCAPTTWAPGSSGPLQFLAYLFGLAPVGNAGSPRRTLFIEIDGLGTATCRRRCAGVPAVHARLIESGRYRPIAGVRPRRRCAPHPERADARTEQGVVGFVGGIAGPKRRVAGANPYHMRGGAAELGRVPAQAGEACWPGAATARTSVGGAWSVLTIAGANPQVSARPGPAAEPGRAGPESGQGVAVRLRRAVGAAPGDGGSRLRERDGPTSRHEGLSHRAGSFSNIPRAR